MDEAQLNTQKILIKLCEKELWDIDNSDPEHIKVIVDSTSFDLGHPYQIYLRIYRDYIDPIQKLAAMRQINKWLWPESEKTWNYWQERMFLAHCERHKEIVFAGGSGIGKSATAAKLALIFWLSRPRDNAVIVASTTMDSLENRIWGYVAMYANSVALPLALRILSSKPPKVLHPKAKDKIHGIFAIPIARGEENKVLATLIGRHPNKNLMMILDEATDMNPVILNSTINLESGVDSFQVIAIGNSASKFDLHGAMATPMLGFKSIDPRKDYTWTTKRGGICLYFDPFDSPAIHEKDPVKRILLSKFLITTDKLNDRTTKYGFGTDQYNRFVLGFWGAAAVDELLFSPEFIEEHLVQSPVEWSGMQQMKLVASFDPAFSVGTRQCVLRIGMIGQSASGLMVLDFRGTEMLHYINIRVDVLASSEQQMADQILALLTKYGIPLDHLVLDATGTGRAVGTLLVVTKKLELSRNGMLAPNQVISEPIKIISTRKNLVEVILKKKKTLDPSTTVVSPIELWLLARDYIENNQIRGIDPVALQQLTNRKIVSVNRQISLETKTDYKTRMGAINPSLAKSPDEVDTLMLAVYAAKKLYAWTPGQVIPISWKTPGERIFSEKMHAAKVEGEHTAMMEARSGFSAARPRLTNNFSSPIENFAHKKNY